MWVKEEGTNKFFLVDSLYKAQVTEVVPGSNYRVEGFPLVGNALVIKSGFPTEAQALEFLTEFLWSS